MQAVADKLDGCRPALRNVVLGRLAKHILAAERIGRARLARRVVTPFAIHNNTVAVDARGKSHGCDPDSVGVPLHRDVPLAPMGEVAHQHDALSSRRDKLNHLFPVLQSCNFAQGRQRSGVRWQSAAATPLFERGPASESGVALRFPPHSKPCGCGASRAVFIRIHNYKTSSLVALGASG